MPALLAVLPITIRPALRRGPYDYELEPVTVIIFAWPHFTFDVERLQLPSHVFLLSKPSSEPTAEATVCALIVRNDGEQRKIACRRKR